MVIIKGSINSGKTSKLIEKSKGRTNVLFVTPTPAVKYIEQEFAQNSIQGRVVGEDSLPSFVCEEAAYTKKRLTPLEQVLVVGDLVRENRKDLIAFSKLHSSDRVVSQISDFITDCQENMVYPSDLKKVQLKGNDKDVMHDVILIYEKFLEHLKKTKKITEAYAFAKCLIALEKKASVTYDMVVFDTLDKYSICVINLINYFSKRTNTVVALLEESKNAALDRNFKYVTALEDSKKVEKALEDVKTGEEELYATTVSGGIRTLAETFFSREHLRETAPKQGVHLNSFLTAKEEVLFIAEKIQEAVSEGFKPNEIVIVSEDIERYLPLFDEVFEEKNILYSYTEKTYLKGTEIGHLLETVFTAYEEGITGETVKDLAHLPFLKFSLEEQARIERFFTRFGNQLQIALSNGKIYDKFNAEKVSQLCMRIQTLLEPVFKALDSHKVKNAVVEVSNFINMIGVDKYLYSSAQKLRSEGKIDESTKQELLWQKLSESLMTLYNCYCDIDDDISFDEVKAVFERMLADTVITNKESYVNHVEVMNSRKAKNRKSSILFVIGCTEGSYPLPMSEHLFSDEGRRSMKLPFAKSDARTAEESMSDIYLAITKPVEELYISWPKVGPTNEMQREAGCLRNVENVFGNSGETVKGESSEGLLKLLNALSTYRYTGYKEILLDSEKKCNDNSLDTAFNEYLKTNPGELAKALKFMKVEPRSIAASKEEITSCYKQTISPTEIEVYEKCPFQHFVDYGLRPYGNKTFDETAIDRGNYYHEIFQKFFDMTQGRPFDKLEDLIAVLDPIIDEVEKDHNENIFFSSPKFKYKGELMRLQATKAVWAATEQINAGIFRPVENEHRFFMKENGVNLTGVIDRIDIARTNGETFVRVIDYKSGSTTFSRELLEAGVQVQLPLYVKAVKEQCHDSTIAGMYYFGVCSGLDDADKAEPKLKKYKLSGLTLQDETVAIATDESLEPMAKSQIVRLEIKKDGNFSSRSSLTEDFTEFVELAEKALEVSTNGIKSGNTFARPFRNSTMCPCTYCEYSEICAHDKKRDDPFRTQKKAKK